MKTLNEFMNENLINESVTAIDSDEDIQEWLKEHNKSAKLFVSKIAFDDLNYDEDATDYLLEMSETVIDNVKGRDEKHILKAFNINPSKVLCWKHWVDEENEMECITYAQK